jgi:hypothetical protein
MAVPDSMRTSDAERDQVLDRLREALVEGRLDSGEFDERATATLAAKTHGQLRVITEDLPLGPSRPLVALAEPTGADRSAVRRVARVSRRAGSIPVGWVVFVVCTLVWLIPGHHVGFFWPGWLLFWAVFSFHGHNRARIRHSERQRRQSQDRGSERLERR